MSLKFFRPFHFGAAMIVPSHLVKDRDRDQTRGNTAMSIMKATQGSRKPHFTNFLCEAGLRITASTPFLRDEPHPQLR